MSDKSYELKVQLKQGIIKGNMQDIKNSIKATLAEYKNIAYGENAVAEMKADRAELNKQKKAVQAEFKRVKDEYMAPLNEFKKDVDELIAMFDPAMATLDAELEAFEKKRVEERGKEIQAEFLSILPPELEEYKTLVWNKVFDKSMLLKTTSTKAWKTKLSEGITSIQKDLSAIENVQSDYKEEGKKVYLDTLNLSEALNRINALEAEAKLIREREAEKLKKEAEEKLRIEREAQEREIRRKAEEEAAKVLEAEKAALEEDRRLLEAETAKAREEIERAKEEAQVEPEEVLGDIPFSIADDEDTESTVIRVFTTDPSILEDIESYLNMLGVNYEM